MYKPTVTEADLALLLDERERADRLYNEALTALDRALLQPRPLPGAAPPDTSQLDRLQRLWQVLPPDPSIVRLPPCPARCNSAPPESESLTSRQRNSPFNSAPPESSAEKDLDATSIEIRPFVPPLRSKKVSVGITMLTLSLPCRFQLPHRDLCEKVRTSPSFSTFSWSRSSLSPVT